MPAAAAAVLGVLLVLGALGHAAVLIGSGLVLQALVPALPSAAVLEGAHLVAPLKAAVTTVRIADLARSVNPDLDPELAWRIAAAVRREAVRRELDPLLVAAVIRVESRFNPAALGAAGEIGLMQVLPATLPVAARAAGLPVPTPEQAWEPELNIALGTAYLAENLRLVARTAPTADPTVLALVSYNRGLQRAVAEFHAGQPVHDYGLRVLEAYETWRIAAGSRTGH